MKRYMLLGLLLMAVLTGCREAVDGVPLTPQATAVPTYTVTLSTDPETLVVGEATLVFVVAAPDGSPVPTEQIQLLSAQGDMTHAGMVPVIEDGRAASFATGRTGRYAMPFNFNMAGDWIITGTVTLRDGTVIIGTLNTSVR